MGLVLGFVATLVWFLLSALRAGLGLFTFCKICCLIVISVISLCFISEPSAVGPLGIFSALQPSCLFFGHSGVLCALQPCPRLFCVCCDNVSTSNAFQGFLSANLPAPVIMCRVSGWKWFSQLSCLTSTLGSLMFGVFWNDFFFFTFAHPTLLPPSEDRFIAFEGDYKFLRVSLSFPALSPNLGHFSSTLVKTCRNEWFALWNSDMSCQPTC